MLPVVDPHTEFTCEGQSLVSRFATLDSVHLLKAIHVQPIMSLSNAMVDLTLAEKLATTPGSGGLPNGIIAAVDIADLFERATTLVDIAQHPRVCGITCHHITGMACKTDAEIIRLFDTLSMLQLPIDVWPGVADVALLASIASRFADAPVIVNVVPTTSGTEPTLTAEDLQPLAQCDRVQLKVGVRSASSADSTTHAAASILPLINLFGVSRILFAGYYSASMTAAEYACGWQVLADITRRIPARDRDQLFRSNAMMSYAL